MINLISNKKSIFQISIILVISILVGYLFYKNIFMLTIALWIAVPLSIIFSFKNYYKTNNKFKAKLLIIGSILVGIIYAIKMLSIYIVLSDLYISLDNIKINYNDPKFVSMYNSILHDKEKALSERISISNKLASSVYCSSGTTLEVINKSGAMSTYMPTKNDINYRKNIAYLKVENTKMIKYKKYSSILFVVVLFISVLIGVALMRRQRSLYQNIEVKQ